MSTVVGLADYSETEIVKIVHMHMQKLREDMHFEDLDFSVQSVQLFGSRVFGKPKKKSDLDIKICFTGMAREDDLFNALNDKRERLYIENIKVDFYTEKL